MPKLRKKEGAFQPSGETQRVVSLGQGTWAYLFDEAGKKHHVKRTSDRIIEVASKADVPLGGRIRAELVEMGWDDVVTRLDAYNEANNPENGE